MLMSRIIPILLLKNRGFYKGVRFKNHQYIGDPINTIKIFNDKEVDELIILDIEASKSKKSIDFSYIKEIVSEAFVPVAYGGGIKTVADAQQLFSLGIEKIVLNTNAIYDEEFIPALVEVFGSQSIVFSLDIKKTWLGYKVYSHSGTKNTGFSPLELSLKMQDAGVGEILLNCIDKDGTFSGYDLDLIRILSNKLLVPLIVAGGASSLDDFINAKSAGADAMAAGSMFVYHGPHNAVLISYPGYDKRKNTILESNYVG